MEQSYGNGDWLPPIVVEAYNDTDEPEEVIAP